MDAAVASDNHLSRRHSDHLRSHVEPRKATGFSPMKGKDRESTKSEKSGKASLSLSINDVLITYPCFLVQKSRNKVADNAIHGNGHPDVSQPATDLDGFDFFDVLEVASSEVQRCEPVQRKPSRGERHVFLLRRKTSAQKAIEVTKFSNCKTGELSYIYN